jgi:hypothetical protein
MPVDRMPRKLLTDWVEHARLVGCPQMTLGHTPNKALNSYDLPTDFGQWSTLAADRGAWQQRIGARPPCPRPATKLARAFRRPHIVPLSLLLRKKYSSDAYSRDE